MPTRPLLIDPAPMGEMNTTPLIDVLLVLLIMFIMAVPVASHVIPIDLPPPNPVDHPLPLHKENVLSLTPQGGLTWNGRPLSEGQLVVTLSMMQRIKPEPLLTFQPDALAPYGASARALNLVKASGLRLFAFTGNENYADFGKQAASAR